MHSKSEVSALDPVRVLIRPASLRITAARMRQDIGLAWPSASRARKIWYLATEPGLRAVMGVRLQILLEESGMAPLARLVRFHTAVRYGVDWVPGAQQ